MIYYSYKTCLRSFKKFCPIIAKLQQIRYKMAEYWLEVCISAQIFQFILWVRSTTATKYLCKISDGYTYSLWRYGSFGWNLVNMDYWYDFSLDSFDFFSTNLLYPSYEIRVQNLRRLRPFVVEIWGFWLFWWTWTTGMNFHSIPLIFFD
jgi:hypothetical protein